MKKLFRNVCEYIKLGKLCIIYILSVYYGEDILLCIMRNKNVGKDYVVFGILGIFSGYILNECL